MIRDSDAPIVHELDSEPAAEAMKRHLSELQRYAGWLSKDHASVAVRADVRALEAAMDTGDETSWLLMTLDKDLGRLPSGGIRTMLRRALGQIRAVIGPTGGDEERRDRS